MQGEGAGGVDGVGAAQGVYPEAIAGYTLDVDVSEALGCGGPTFTAPRRRGSPSVVPSCLTCL
jgi:hypothetical protein